jgi:hypothetical protein
MWRVVFEAESSLLVGDETREEARLTALAWAWLATGKWLKIVRIERK